MRITIKIFIIVAILFINLAMISSLGFALSVALQWDPDAEPDLAGYKVYYQAGSSTLSYSGDRGQ